MFEFGDVGADLNALLTVLANGRYADYHLAFFVLFVVAVPASAVCLYCRGVGLHRILKSGGASVMPTETGGRSAAVLDAGAWLATLEAEAFVAKGMLCVLLFEDVPLTALQVAIIAQTGAYDDAPLVAATVYGVAMLAYKVGRAPRGGCTR